MKKRNLLIIYLFFILITISSSFLFLLKEKNLNKIKSYVIDTKYEFFARKVYYTFKYGLSAYDDGEIFYLTEKYLKKEIITKNKKREKIIGIDSNLNKHLKNYHNSYKPEVWIRSHGGNKNQKFSESFQINKDNIKKLKPYWIYESDKNKVQNIEANPVFHNGSMIALSADRNLISMNIERKKINWKFKFEEYLAARRGFVIDNSEEKPYIYATTDKKLYKINFENGKLDEDFNKKGYVKNIFSLTAPFITKNKIYVANVTPPSLIIFNKKTGKKISSIDLNPDGKNFTGSSPWMGMALDKKNNIAFISTGNPRPAMYGITRKGANKNSNSIIAIDLIKEKILWSFQEVAHDLWDFDIGCPPLLTEIKFEKKFLEVVVCVTKTGNTLILERNTGKSLFDIDFKNIPSSNIPDQEIWQQINLIKPKNISPVEYKYDSFNKLNSKKKNKITKILEDVKLGWFEPPKFGEKIVFFGIHGGSNWYGSTTNPKTNQLFTPINHIPYEAMLYGTDISNDIPSILKNHDLYLKNCSSCHGEKRNIKIEKISEQILKNIPSLTGLSLFKKTKSKNLSYMNFKKKHNLNIDKETFNLIIEDFFIWDKYLLKNKKIKLSYYWGSFMDKEDKSFLSNPPWGEIVSIGLKDGKLLWRTPIGMEKNKIIGTAIYGGCSTNSNNILFCVGTEDSYIYALDGDNGDIIWKYKLNYSGTAPPLIFSLNNNEYVAVIASGSNIVSKKPAVRGNEIYIFSIN